MTSYWSYARSSSNVCAQRCTNIEHALEQLEAARVIFLLPTVNVCKACDWSGHLFRASEKKWAIFFLPTVNACKACDWSGHLFGASASPRPLIKTPARPVIGRDTFSALAPGLGRLITRKLAICYHLPLLFMAVSMIAKCDIRLATACIRG